MDDIAACLADMENDIALLKREGHPTTRPQRSIESLRRLLDASRCPPPEHRDQ
ncbi:hypothetical protein [Paraburkholderia bannensis]|uniref:hypothetical protein n=1 Tax=Paraburkholderia bannensis TaxID=765414 RepID=UPI002ABD82D2|nr:hypothetical protein [Paraburkholderia bannensis]